MTAHLLICILARESPLQGLPVSVAIALPSGHLARQDLMVGDASSQTLSSEHADLDLGHVQPTGVFRGVVKLHAAQQPRRRRRAENFDEALAEVSIEIVQDQMDAPRRTVPPITELSRRDSDGRPQALVSNVDTALLVMDSTATSTCGDSNAIW